MRLPLALVFLLVLASVVPADDWPMLNGRPDRNPLSNEKNLPATFTVKNVKWTAALGDHCYGNPAVAGGKVFVPTNNEVPRDPSVKGDKGVLMCFSAADGKFLWQAVNEKLPKSQNEQYPALGVCSSPAVAGDRVYYLSNWVEVVCCSVADGKRVWALDLKTLGVQQSQAPPCSPVVVDGRVFVITGQSVDVKSSKVLHPEAPSFLALDAVTGKILWQDASPGDRILDTSWGSPAYGVVEGQPQVIFPGGDGWLYSFEPATGKLLWKFNTKADEKLGTDGKPETNNVVLGVPVIEGHRVLVTAGQDVDTSGDPGCLRAIDARKRGEITKTGELWRLAGKAFGRSSSSVAVKDGLIYAAELSGIVHCVELETGKAVWDHDLLATVWWQPVLADGKLYVRTGDGDVWVFQEGREKKAPVKSTLPDLEQGMVVISNGTLFITGPKKLYAVAATP